MGATFLGLTVPDLSLGDAGSAKVTTTITNGGIEGPRRLERWGRTGCALSRDKAGEEGGGDEGGERTHPYRSVTGGMMRKGSRSI